MGDRGVVFKTRPDQSHQLTVAGFTQDGGLYLEGGAKRGGFDPDHSLALVGVQAAHRLVVHTRLSVEKNFKLTLKDRNMKEDEETLLKRWSHHLSATHTHTHTTVLVLTGVKHECVL